MVIFLELQKIKLKKFTPYFLSGKEKLLIAVIILYTWKFIWVCETTDEFRLNSNNKKGKTT